MALRVELFRVGGIDWNRVRVRAAPNSKHLRRIGLIGWLRPLQDRQCRVFVRLSQVEPDEVTDRGHTILLQTKVECCLLNKLGCRRNEKPRRPRPNQKTPPSSATRPDRDCLCPQGPLLPSGCSPDPKRTRRSLPPCKSAFFAPP